MQEFSKINLIKTCFDSINVSKETIKSTTKCSWLHPMTRDSLINTMKKNIEQSKRTIIMIKKLK